MNYTDVQKNTSLQTSFLAILNAVRGRETHRKMLRVYYGTIRDTRERPKPGADERFGLLILMEILGILGKLVFSQVSLIVSS